VAFGHFPTVNTRNGDPLGLVANVLSAHMIEGCPDFFFRLCAPPFSFLPPLTPAHACINT
jgi:hypothetical protein